MCSHFLSQQWIYILISYYASNLKNLQILLCILHLTSYLHVLAKTKTMIIVAPSAHFLAFNLVLLWLFNCTMQITQFTPFHFMQIKWVTIHSTQTHVSKANHVIYSAHASCLGHFKSLEFFIYVSRIKTKQLFILISCYFMHQYLSIHSIHASDCAFFFTFNLYFAHTQNLLPCMND